VQSWGRSRRIWRGKRPWLNVARFFFDREMSCFLQVFDAPQTASFYFLFQYLAKKGFQRPVFFLCGGDSFLNNLNGGGHP